jgi:hypothetical protein
MFIEFPSLLNVIQDCIFCVLYNREVENDKFLADVEAVCVPGWD